MGIFGAQLRHLRQKAELTQEDMAEKLGVLRTNYIPYETGRSLPGDDILVSLSEILKVPSDQLYILKTADEITRKYSPEAIKEAYKFSTRKAPS